MRIKEEFKRSRAFWLLSSPEREIPGSFSISDGGVIKLGLTQSLDTSNLNQILGHVEIDGPVMIDSCYYITRKRSIVRGALMRYDITNGIY